MLTKYFSKESLTLFALCTSGIAILIQGPSRLLGFNEYLPATVIGFIFLGAMEAFIFVPLMPLIIEAVLDKQTIDPAYEEALNDKASSIFQGAQAVGCILGPILGGLLNDHFEFQGTCDIMAITCLAYATIYFAVNVLPALRERREVNALRASVTEESRAVRVLNKGEVLEGRSVVKSSNMEFEGKKSKLHHMKYLSASPFKTSNTYKSRS